MPEDISLEPKPTASPAPAETAAGEIPDEVLQQPVMQALMAGSPPAVSADINALGKTELGKLLDKHGEMLKQAGMGFYRSRQGNLGAMFNQLYINPQDIVAADEQGQLTQVAPPIEEIEKAIAADPSTNPVLSASGPPPSPAMAGAVAPEATAAGAPPPNPRVQTARRQNVEPGSPTSGPRPGAGRVLNAILKPVI